MKKEYFIYTSLIIIIGLLFYFSDNTNISSKEKEVVYNGNNLLISIDGKESNTLPTSGNYYLADYDCSSTKTKLSWDRENYKLNISNGTKKSNVSCNLNFKSQPLLNEMEVGSYVEYVGEGGVIGATSVACKVGGESSSSAASEETEAPNSCLGQNAREDLDTSGYTYGYCYSSHYKYYTTGWRIAYIDSNGKPVIVSAGSPECNSRVSSIENSTYIKTANSLAMKYCNSEFVDGNCSCLDSNNDGLCDCTDSDSDGLCDEIENNQVDAWAISDIDFYNITKLISGYGKRLGVYSSSLGNSGGSLGDTLYCSSMNSYEECGYNNDLIDNGGYYWFAARPSSSSTYGVAWDPYYRIVSDSSISNAYGLRPIISLSSSVVVTGGTGTMDDPYTLANNTFLVSEYINSKSNVELKLVGSSNVSTMCISVDTSECTNYEEFSSFYVLDLSTFDDGARTIYVYYKDNGGNIIASKNKTVILDTVAPTDSSISIGDGYSFSRTLTLSSTGADYMCFSNENDDVNDCNDWVPYATSYNWQLSSGEGEKTVYAFFKDKADNIVRVSDSVTFALSDMPVGEVYSLDYTGDVVVSSDLGFKFGAGTYKLEVWGAQGGNSGGKGGYSVGTVSLTGSETLYFYVGGAGDLGIAGFNGGGTTGAGAGGGGGATDIRINSTSNLARVIVAGGGGGKSQDTCGAGGAGGGTSGIGGLDQGSCSTQAGAGTQTAGGAVGVYSTTNGANAGTFAAGGAAADGSYDGGGGGGGWYGGGAGASAGWSNGGGGGSGFVYTSSSTLPSGYLLGTAYRLTNASTIAGDQSTIPTIDGSSTEIGHAGNGYIKITRLS